jgi:hypothetical protein
MMIRLRIINDADNSYVFRIEFRVYYKRIKLKINNFLRLIYY